MPEIHFAKTLVQTYSIYPYPLYLSYLAILLAYMNFW